MNFTMNKILLIKHIGFNCYLYEENDFFYFTNPASIDSVYLFNHLTKSRDENDLTRSFKYKGIYKLEQVHSKRQYDIIYESNKSYVGVYESDFIKVYKIVHKHNNNFQLI